MEQQVAGDGAPHLGHVAAAIVLAIVLGDGVGFLVKAQLVRLVGDLEFGFGHLLRAGDQAGAVVMDMVGLLAGGVGHGQAPGADHGMILAQRRRRCAGQRAGQQGRERGRQHGQHFHDYLQISNQRHRPVSAACARCGSTSKPFRATRVPGITGGSSFNASGLSQSGTDASCTSAPNCSNRPNSRTRINPLRGAITGFSASMALIAAPMVRCSRPDKSSRAGAVFSIVPVSALNTSPVDAVEGGLAGNGSVAIMCMAGACGTDNAGVFGRTSRRVASAGDDAVKRGTVGAIHTMTPASTRPSGTKTAPRCATSTTKNSICSTSASASPAIHRAEPPRRYGAMSFSVAMPLTFPPPTSGSPDRVRSRRLSCCPC